MGNKYRITWISEPKNVADIQQLRSDISQRLIDVNQSMSTWQHNSEISGFNRSKAGEITKISEPFKAVLSESLRIHGLTAGALDVTLGPLVKLWGFGPSNHDYQVPLATELSSVKAYTGIEHLSINGLSISKDHDLTELDFSAIAKGFGVDQVAEILDSHKIKHYLIDIGGEVYGKGHNLKGTPWQIKVEKPTIYIRGLTETIPVSNMAVATSGDYRNKFSQGGGNYSHVIDPNSGQSVRTRISSATVIAEHCATADGLATAAMVMGVEKTLALAEQQQLAVMLIENKYDRFVVHKSTAYNELQASQYTASPANKPQGQ
ncbi:FAD:protein FMN transferase [Shewanella sp. 10N.286.54.B9]|uniref:FAD:protein FMN transferase n=1 Tax=Shewanella sp. 10N.286.54.B9 TaxID=3229719 RepID=UPI0035527FC0